jgi:multidrug efflux pump subunit AcrB
LRSRRDFALAIAMLTTAGIAVAAQPQTLAILVQCVVSNRSAGRVEDMLTSPLERALNALPRVVNIASVTSNSANGVTVELEIYFDGGANGQDLVAVLGQVGQLEINKEVGPTAVSVHLGLPRIDKETGLLLR